MRSSKYTSKFLYFKSNTKEAFSVVNEPTVRIGIIVVSSTRTPRSIEEIGTF